MGVADAIIAVAILAGAGYLLVRSLWKGGGHCAGCGGCGSGARDAPVAIGRPGERQRTRAHEPRPDARGRP